MHSNIIKIKSLRSEGECLFIQTDLNARNFKYHWL